VDVKENELLEPQTVFIECVSFSDLKSRDGNLAQSVPSALFLWFREGISAIRAFCYSLSVGEVEEFHCRTGDICI
jgi:hypothetical protein